MPTRKLENTPLIEGPSRTIRQEQLQAAYSRLQVIKKIVTRALPIGLSYTFTSSLTAINILMDHLNDEPNKEEAAALILVLLNFTSIFAISTVFATSIDGCKIRARFLKNADEEARRELNALLRNGLLTASISAPLACLALFFSKEILVHVFKQNEAVSTLAAEFLVPYAPTMLSLTLRLGLENIAFIYDLQFLVMVLSMSSFGVSTFLASALSKGQAGLPALGIRGIAYSYDLDNLMVCALFTTLLLFHKKTRDFQFFRHWFTFTRSDIQKIKTLLKIGLPITVALLSETLADFMASVFAGWVSNDALAVQDLLSQIAIFGSIFFLSSGQAACQLTSSEIGAQNYENASLVARWAIPSSFILLLPIGLLTLIAPRVYTNLITNDLDPKGLELVRYTSAIAVGTLFLKAASFNMQQILRSADDLWVPALYANFLLWLGTFTEYWLSKDEEIGIYGIAAAACAGVAAGVASLLPRFLNKTAPEALERTARAPNNAPSSGIFGKVLSFFSHKETESPALSPGYSASINV